ncbi:hypothetical protein P691DRAFT_9540 [Macrolepiota fuliginosa MF-IS2]|uniref:ATP-dependent DNA helicase n=1 Tax=Macrolepiota fuliginosa MF-IS2 TaxID=1400762 RepID=A0A9P6CBF0_9AGAR|nr:hypothetical protein P691DRAFT_9540 [Macrolepiota fuliginosa MF-IS2]
MSSSLQSTVQEVHDFNESGRAPTCSTTPAAPEITLSPEQRNILGIVKAGGNVFFTGPAGTGKSVLLRAITKALLETKPFDTIAVTATTGIAALAIGGQTIHSYGGIGIGSEVVELLVKRIRRSRKLRQKWQRTQVWVIDEVSMLKAELFDKLVSNH